MSKRPFTFAAIPEIRDPKPADAQALAGLMGELGYPDTAEALWARLQRMSAPTHRTFLADLDGRVAGFAGASIVSRFVSDAPTCWVTAFIVAAPYRRHGVGRTLLKSVEEWAASMGLTEVRVHCAEGRHDGHSFYQSCGYNRTGLRFCKALRHDVK